MDLVFSAPLRLCASASSPAPEGTTAIAEMVQSGTILGVILRLLRAGLRRVFNLSFLAVVSLLLLIGLGCLWERSMRVRDDLKYTRSSGQSVILATLPRRLYIELNTPRHVSQLGGTRWEYTSARRIPGQVGSIMEMMWDDSWLGFDLYDADHQPHWQSYHVTRVKIPLWFLMVLTLIVPLCWLRRWRRQARRVRLGLCLHCGYDLRATPDGTGPHVARCPECGREPS